ncbi:hypothetical protein L7F22_031834 [Adiantum nelumboides]|nr:hypothetical protein [Adiantum nelumboides]
MKEQLKYEDTRFQKITASYNTVNSTLTALLQNQEPASAVPSTSDSATANTLVALQEELQIENLQRQLLVSGFMSQTAQHEAKSVHKTSTMWPCKGESALNGIFAIGWETKVVNHQGDRIKCSLLIESVVLRLPDTAARMSEFELFVTRFDGSDFSWWSSHMLDALTYLGQALPLQGKDARPESMSDTAWEDLDALASYCVRDMALQSPKMRLEQDAGLRDGDCALVGIVDIQDILKGVVFAGCNSAGVNTGDVRMSLPSGAFLVLRHVCHQLSLTRSLISGLCPSVDSSVAQQESSDTETMTSMDERHDNALMSFTDMPLPMSDSLSHGTSCVDVIARETDAFEPCMAMLINTESVDEPDFREQETDVLFYNASNMFEDDSVLQTSMYDHGASDATFGSDARIVLGTYASLVEHESSMRLLLRGQLPEFDRHP